MKIHTKINVYVFAFLVLLISIFASGISARAIQPDERKVCIEVFSYIRAISKTDRPSSTNEANLTFEGILLVASFQSDYSDQFLLKFTENYIGSAPGAYLSDLIRKKGRKILNALTKFKERPASCDPQVYRCPDQKERAQKLIDQIRQQKQPELDVDNSGDPFSYIPEIEIAERFENFNKKVK